MPAEGVYVFDACAVIALLQEEPGASIVVDLLQTGDQRCLVYAINVCEVYYDIYRREGEEIADGVNEILEGYGFELIEEVPAPSASSDSQRSATQRHPRRNRGALIPHRDDQLTRWPA